MYKISHHHNKEEQENYIELEDTNSNSFAKILLNKGGSLHKLSLEKKELIKDLSPLLYDTTFASAILFPFTNRIRNGTYTFKQKKYTLDLNLKEENNAIHGLVYNKEFEIVSEEVSEELARVTLKYVESEKPKGFPYKFTITLIYTLTKSGLSLEVIVKNNDDEAFPFNVGWHPYFNSSNLHESVLNIESDKKLSFNANMIPDDIQIIDPITSLQIKNTFFDDCFILNNNNISFKTPDYKIGITSSSKENYLQVFTPKKANTIALEPITAPGNSFNNKLGLQILNPNETHSVSWKIKLLSNE